MRRRSLRSTQIFATELAHIDHNSLAAATIIYSNSWDANEVSIKRCINSFFTIFLDFKVNFISFNEQNILEFLFKGLLILKELLANFFLASPLVYLN